MSDRPQNDRLGADDNYHLHGEKIGHTHDRGSEYHTHSHRVIKTSEDGMIKTIQDTVTFTDTGEEIIAKEWTVDYHR